MSFTVNPNAPRAGRYRCDACLRGFAKPEHHLCRGRRYVAPWVQAAVSRRTKTEENQ